MKKLFLICVSSVCICGSVLGTPVLFTLQSLTGTVNNRSILVTPDTYQNPLVIGTNLVSLVPFVLQPTNGSVTTNLAPWGYTIRVDGWPRSVHINVADGTNTVPVYTLINTNAFSPLQIYYPSSTNINNATGTNVVIGGLTLNPALYPNAIIPANYTLLSSYYIGNSNWLSGSYPNARYGQLTYLGTSAGSNYIEQLFGFTSDYTGVAPSLDRFILFDYDPSGNSPSVIRISPKVRFGEDNDANQTALTNLTYLTDQTGRIPQANTIVTNFSQLPNVDATGKMPFGFTGTGNTNFTPDTGPILISPLNTNRFSYWTPNSMFVFGVNNASGVGGLVYGDCAGIFVNASGSQGSVQPGVYLRGDGSYFQITKSDNSTMVDRIDTNGATFPTLTLTGTTNQIIFGGTNTPPVSTNLVRWISVKIAGDTNIWKLGLAK